MHVIIDTGNNMTVHTPPHHTCAIHLDILALSRLKFGLHSGNAGCKLAVEGLLPGEDQDCTRMQVLHLHGDAILGLERCERPPQRIAGAVIPRLSCNSGMTVVSKRCDLCLPGLITMKCAAGIAGSQHSSSKQQVFNMLPLMRLLMLRLVSNRHGVCHIMHRRCSPACEDTSAMRRKCIWITRFSGTFHSGSLHIGCDKLPAKVHMSTCAI